MALEALWFLNTRVEIRRASAESADGVAIAEHRLPFGDSAPLHVHEREAEIFHLLEGEMRFRVGETETLARAGDTLVAPPGVPHTFRVESSGGARCLVITPGGDFEGLIRAFARPAEGPGLPEPTAPTPEQIAALGVLALANRIELLGPPM